MLRSEDPDTSGTFRGAQEQMRSESGRRPPQGTDEFWEGFAETGSCPDPAAGERGSRKRGRGRSPRETLERGSGTAEQASRTQGFSDLLLLLPHTVTRSAVLTWAGVAGWERSGHPELEARLVALGTGSSAVLQHSPSSSCVRTARLGLSFLCPNVLPVAPCPSSW